MSSLRWLLIINLLCVSVAFAHKKPIITPEHVDGITTVHAQKLAKLMLKDKKLIVIDARVMKGRKKGFIENSYHLPDIETNCASLQKLIPRLNNPVVFYCSSNTCGRSLNAVQIAKRCGYSHLYWFRGGFKEWKSEGYAYKK